MFFVIITSVFFRPLLSNFNEQRINSKEQLKDIPIAALSDMNWRVLLLCSTSYIEEVILLTSSIQIESELELRA